MNKTQSASFSIEQLFKSDTYTLIEKIGHGGFGQVYKAKHLTTNQFVAIKFLTLNPEFDDDKKRRYIDRFERETLLSSRLQHPHIVRLLDKGMCESDLLYAVFEYVDGDTLRYVLNEQGPLSPVDTSMVMGQVLDALAHAHEQGVIHRDVKPANIMLVKTGAKLHVKVLDFGIGTLVNEARQLDYKSITLTQETLGTPSYSAPEQLRGEPPTPKTDLYVWGLVFIECLTGAPAVSGASLAAVFHKQLSASNVPLPAAVAGHPVSALLRRVLNKKTSERVATAADIYQELGQLNFSTLVGDFAATAKSPAGQDTTANMQVMDEDTIISEQGHTFTSLTERKQITVLCVCLDVVASGTMDVDNEVVGTLHRDQVVQCSDIAIRYGGFHVGTLGDTLLFYFGYPASSDNDTRLAARTALDIASDLAKRNVLLRQTQGIEMKARMGLHTGMVIAYADTVPEGETANIAMALARMASPGQILSSDINKKRLDTYIEFQPREQVALGILQQPQSIHALVGERQVEAFGFLRANRRGNRFIGRQSLLALLVELTKSDKSAQGASNKHAAHVEGEAGIGKSRLIFELRDKAKGFYQHVAQCLPEHKNNALYPILNVIRYKYSLDTLSLEEAVQCLRAAIAQNADFNEVQMVAILCAWLGYPLPDDIEPSPFTPDIQKQMLFDALTYLLNAQQHDDFALPNLFLFEDMHWADPTSLEFVVSLLNNPEFKQAGHMFVSTSREPLPQVLPVDEFEQIKVEKLSSAETTEFITHLFDQQNVSKNVLDLLIKRTDGIPLFIEELVNMLKQKQLVRHLNGVIDFTSPDKLAEVPNSLLDSLQQKLDALVYAKETAQLAATIGREFNYDLLVAVSNRNDSQVQTDLQELIEAEMVFLQRKVSGDSYIFKHALVRDAAYTSMASRGRVSAHHNIARVMASGFAGIADNNPAEVAEHFAGAECFEQAAQYGIQAIDKQVRSSANDEAISIGDTALPWSLKIADSQQAKLTELNVHSAMLPALMTLFGYGAQRVNDWVERVGELTGELKVVVSNDEVLDTLKQMDSKCQWTEFLSAHYCSHRLRARELGEQLLTLLRKEGRRQDEIVLRTHLGQAYNMDGDLLLSRDTYESALAMYDEKLDADMGLAYGMDPRVQALSLCSYNYLHLGELTIAREYAYRALDYAEKIGNLGEIVFANIFAALYHVFLKEFDDVARIWHDYNRRHGAKGEIFYLFFFRCYCYSALREPELAEQAMQPQIDSGQVFAVGYYVTHVAEAYLDTNKVDDAVRLMEEALARSTENKELSVFPFLKKTLAQCYYQQDGELTIRINDLLLSSINDAIEQKARYFELENRVYLAELMGNDNSHRQSQIDHITKLFTWFTEQEEGVETPLYRRTQVLLNEQ